METRNLALLPPNELRYEVFAQHYVANGYNALKAAVAAGWENPSPNLAANIRSRPLVRQRIAEIVQDHLDGIQVDADRVKEEIARIAFADPRGLFNTDGSLRQIADLDDDTAATVAGFDVEVKLTKRRAGADEFDDGPSEQTETRVVKIKRHDKVAALGLLAKHFKLVGDDAADGLNALAGALADRLDAAKRRANAGDVVDVEPTEPAAPPLRPVIYTQAELADTIPGAPGDPLDAQARVSAEPMQAVAPAPAPTPLHGGPDDLF